MKLGFIGLGNIGGVMARRLVAQGHELTVHDINPGAVQALTALGAVSSESPADLASRCDVVFLSLPTPAVVHSVALGPNGLGEGTSLKAVVDLSTTGPSTSAVVAEGLAARRVEFLDAPVSGGVSGAAKGTLAIMTSGPEQLHRSVEHVLRNIGQNIFYLGPQAGQAQTMKLVNNLMAATSVVACCEGLVLGAKAGLDTQTMLEVLNASSGRSYATETRVADALQDKSFPVRFAASLMQKDVRLCLEEAEKMGVPMWIGPATRQFLAFAIAQGSGSQDFVSTIRHLERSAGVEVAAARSAADST